MSATAQTTYYPPAPYLRPPPPPPPGFAYPVRYAGLVQRFAASVVDLILLGVLTLLLALPFGLTAAALSLSVGMPGWWVGLLFGPLLLLMFLLWVLYFTYFESTTGQTLGKLLFGLKVVDLRTGRPPDAARAFVRTLLRVVDWLPAFYLLGFFVAALTSQRQRLGDMLAETIVLRT